MRYKVLEDNEIFNTISEAVTFCIDPTYHGPDDDNFESWVNDNYDYAYIGGTTYYAYEILEQFGNLGDVVEDFREAMNGQDEDEATYELENANIGDEIECQGYTILVCPDDTDDVDGNVIDSFVAVEAARRYYDEQNELAKIEREKEERTESDMMSLFQHIGG